MGDNVRGPNLSKKMWIYNPASSPDSGLGLQTKFRTKFFKTRKAQNLLRPHQIIRN